MFYLATPKRGLRVLVESFNNHFYKTQFKKSPTFAGAPLTAGCELWVTGTWAPGRSGDRVGGGDPLKPTLLTLFSLPVSVATLGIMAVDVAEYHLSGESQRQPCYLEGLSHQAWGGGVSGTPVTALVYW